MTCGIIRFAVMAALLSPPFYAGTPQSPPTKSGEGHAAKLLRSDSIPNFAEVTPDLYRGGQPTDAAFADLKKRGVDIIVDMRSGSRGHEKQVVTNLGMHYVQIAWHCPFPTDKPFADFLKIVQGNPGKKIMVHCRLGDDRTGMAIASYRMAEQGWSADEAMKEMHEFGFRGFHHLICPGLSGYEKSFPKRLKNNNAFRELHKQPN